MLLVESLYLTFWAILVYVAVLMVALECMVVTIFVIRHRCTRRREDTQGGGSRSRVNNRPRGRNRRHEQNGGPPLNVTRGESVIIQTILGHRKRFFTTEHMLNYDGGVPQGPQDGTDIDNSQFILTSRSTSPEHLPTNTVTAQQAYYIMQPLNNDTQHPQYVY